MKVLKILPSSIAVDMEKPHHPDQYYQSRIGLWMGSGFQKMIISATRATLPESVPLVGVAEIISDKKFVTDQEIKDELPIAHHFDEFTVCRIIAQLVDAQPSGEEGWLAMDNLFYTRTAIARVYRHAYARDWTVSAWRLGAIAWVKGDRVFYVGL